MHLQGIEGSMIEVEADLSEGLQFRLRWTDLPTRIKERVRSAIKISGFLFLLKNYC